MKTAHISRRDVLRAGGLVSAWAALVSCSPIGNLTEQLLATTWASSQVQAAIQPVPLRDDALLLHTLRRTSFGVTQAMLERARAMGLEAYVEEQLAPESLDDSLAEGRVRDLDTMNCTLEELPAEEQRRRVVSEFMLATLVRQAWSPRQFYEVMVDFWTNHFNIFIGKNVVRVLEIVDDCDVIRPHALATFHELLHASVHSPAMLVYLDQAWSSRDAPNENYARELLELYTVGVDSGFTQQDVQETARTLTGWTVVGLGGRHLGPGQQGTFIFRRRQHDDGANR